MMEVWRMRRKVSTLLEDQLFMRVKLEAVRQGRQISEIMGEALANYLDEAGAPKGAGGVVRASSGAMAISAEQLDAIMEEEDDFLGA